jgi:methyltransferase (TIGR00027 family)
MKLSPSFAGLATAAYRVTELYLPEQKRIIDDRFTMKLLPPAWQAILTPLFLPGIRQLLLAWRERQAPGVQGSLLCRTRTIDDALGEALEQGVEQVVILGAGFDSRPYRIPGIDRTSVFEVELPGPQKLKRERLIKALGRIPSHVVFVPIDFERQKLEDVMEEVNFRTGIQTFFIWEGVTQYITADAVDDTLRYVARVGGAGSEIVFTYILRRIITGEDRSQAEERIVSFAARVGSPWKFGFDPDEVDKYLAARGLSLIEEPGAQEWRTRYLEPIGRDLDIFKGERVVRAGVRETTMA